MRFFLPLAILLVAAAPHSGAVERGMTPSDFALFAVAVVAVWLVRRRLRARFLRQRRRDED